MIARSSQDEVELCQVELRHGDVSGYGEAAPIDRYGESAESARAYVEEHAELLGDDPFALDEIFGRLPEREFAARAALDAALHDLCGKLAGQPVWRLLGLRRAGPPTSWTVWLGDPDDMARRAELAAPRFRRLKLKLGGGDGLDVERVRAVRAATDRPLQVDVNEYWTLDEALENLPQLEIDYCEQPLPAGDPGGAELKRRSPCRSSSTRTATRWTTSPRARSERTGSTSSSRSRAASARRCAWRTPRGRSASA